MKFSKKKTTTSQINVAFFCLIFFVLLFILFLNEAIFFIEINNLDALGDEVYDSSTLLRSLEDDELILNGKIYRFIINPKHSICHPKQQQQQHESIASKDEDKVLLLAIVPIAPNKFSERLRIRSTWSNSTIKFNKKSAFNRSNVLKTLFIVGKSLDDESINEKLREEAEKYNDIIQVNFADTYRNLTYKTLSLIKWTAQYCSNAKYLLKVDDDVHVNVNSLVNDLVDKYFDAKMSFLCHINFYGTAIRNVNSKYFVSKSSFNSDKFPIYCDGPAYLLTNDNLTHTLYQLSIKYELFFLEDLFLTGLLAKKINQIGYIFLNHRFERNFDGFLLNALKKSFYKYFVYT